MFSGLGVLRTIAVVLALGLGVASVSGAEPKVTTLENIDLPGFDYSILKDTDLDTCRAACVEESICRAFTFNEKSNWCFLKGAAGVETEFAGAISGRVSHTPSPAVTEAVRQSELPFPAQSLVDDAKRFAANLPQTDAPAPKAVYADLVTSGDEEMTAKNYAGAMVAYRQSLAINANDPVVWQALAEAALRRAAAMKAQSEGDDSSDLARVASSAALNAFLRSSAPDARALALRALANSIEYREMWREAIVTYRLSLDLVPDDAIEAYLDTLIAQHGFRLVNHVVDAEAAAPRICAVFSAPLGATDLSAYVSVANAPQVSVETEHEQICIEGVTHGSRYAIKLRAGLKSADGEALAKDVDLDVYIPDRPPFVGFANNAYVMPAGLGGGLPITSVNAETAELKIYRIGDRGIAAAVRDGIFQNSLSQYSAEEIADRVGEAVWSGEVDLARGDANALTTTAIPVADVLGEVTAGAYVVTAKVKGAEDDSYWRDLATQWFIITDLGLTTIAGDDGVHAFVRGLSSAQPVAGASVRLVAVNNEILGEATTDAEGRAIFAPGLARGQGGRAPQLLVAETTDGDYAFLNLTRPAFDLTDRGVEGRPSPGPLDLFVTTERGVYRPGETVFLTALLRDERAEAVSGLPLTLEMERPDGVIASSQLLTEEGAGGYFAALPIPAEAMRGSWALRLYSDPNADALARASILVEDFEPERLAFDVSAVEDGPFKAGEVNQINIAAKYLYGATAPGLSIEADVILRPRTTLADFPGYSFGRLDDAIETSREPLGKVASTDASGNAVADVRLPDAQITTRPLEAQVLLRLLDTSGRSIERSLTRPVVASTPLLGIKPVFSDPTGLAQGTEAQFEIITVSPGGEAVAQSGIRWTLSRIETNYQWYRSGSSWQWEAITTARDVANGMLDTPDGGPAIVSASVDWGRYRLEVESSGAGATSSSYEFYAGYYYADAGTDTPDTLQVALDKPAYRVGETANLKLDPQFAGTALVMVVDNRVIAMQAVEVPEGGTTVPLKVTDQWGPGAYVTAILYRPADVGEKRMPARALGLAFADIEPGDRKLEMALDVPSETLPRQSFAATVELSNVAPGQTAYVAVAAVDLGILNVTNFKVPSPDDWYFGQRQLGMEIRDLYGALIDPNQGMAGALRSGGDDSAMRLGTPPPISVLVALHSGIVTVDADGQAEVSFDMPDFNGTVRLMAMAWTDTAVGHASADVIVRDPVVVTLSPPRFLRVGDESRLLVEVNNVGGEGGDYVLSLSTGEGISTPSSTNEVALDEGERAALDLKLNGMQIGDWPVVLTITGPDGTTQTKQLLLGVRPASAPITMSRLIPIASGGKVSIGDSYFEGLMSDTGAMTLAIGPIARLDVPGLLLSLDRYPYGCAEQVSSRALPLLYLNDVAALIGVAGDDTLNQVVVDAIANILTKQSSSGGFGLWGPFDGGDLWLDSFVTDFLLRAKAQGYAVPEQAMSMALDNLSNQLSYAADFDKGGEDIAYALYDLARAGRATMGDLRYYFEARLDAFGSPLAQAQLGAALALYGDTMRAASAFAAALESLAQNNDNARRYRADYGSRLRDTAGVLALAAEFKVDGVNLATLTNQLAKMLDRARYTSTQEESWTLLAAAALGQSSVDGSITVDGEAMAGQVYQRYDQSGFSAVELVNDGATATEAKVTVTGYPATAPDAASEGFTLTREYFLPDGTRIDPESAPIAQNDRLVVVLTARPQNLGSGQYVLSDPLPAGFEIENPNLSAGGGVADFSWLKLDAASHIESRTDQFVAAFRYSSDPGTFTTGYLVRAVSPGVFVLPGATVEDIYRPEFRANTAPGSVEVTAAGP